MMGDRGRVKITQWNDKDVYLYSHYDGYQIDRIVQDVLARKLRWGDGPYLSRMIFCAMVGENNGHDDKADENIEYNNYWLSFSSQNTHKTSNEDTIQI